MKVGITPREKITVDVKKAYINLKCRDDFNCILFDEEENKILEYEGYVPNEIFPGEYGDYLVLEIDIDTGVILNWKTPKLSDLENFIENNQNQEGNM